MKLLRTNKSLSFLVKGRWLPLLLTALTALALVVILAGPTLTGESKVDSKKQFKKLTAAEKRVIIDKGTEAAFTGKYYNFHEAGTYVCRQCGAPLYRSSDKFESGCGWPSFDDEIEGAVKRTLDADGRRTEITCAKCGGHLGHVFLGEQFTAKDTRHCVNSISLEFIPANSPALTEDTAYFAGGCFWGTEYFLNEEDGVISTQVGYMGGHTEHPDYKDVCSGTTGHAETVQVVFDPSKVDFETLARLFFEIHDPTQVNRQGPDVGEQYRSAVFYTSPEQKATTESLVQILESKGYKVATEVAAAGPFWKAEEYHQDYYANNGKRPYCHGYVKRF